MDVNQWGQWVGAACPRGCVKRSGCNCILGQPKLIMLSENECTCNRQYAPYPRYLRHHNYCGVSPIFARLVAEMELPYYGKITLDTISGLMVPWHTSTAVRPLDLDSEPGTGNPDEPPNAL